MSQHGGVKRRWRRDAKGGGVVGEDWERIRSLNRKAAEERYKE